MVIEPVQICLAQRPHGVPFELIFAHVRHDFTVAYFPNYRAFFEAERCRTTSIHTAITITTPITALCQ